MLRENYGKCCSGVWHRFYRDLAVMRCDDTVCNCQSKACAALLISDKRGEDIGKMLFGNTAAGVLDFKENLTGGYVTGCKEMDSFVSGPVVNSVCGIAGEDLGLLLSILRSHLLWKEDPVLCKR